MSRKHPMYKAAAAAGLGVTVFMLTPAIAMADDTHENAHSNMHVNSHMNQQTYVHENIQSNAHVNTHTNLHVNEHVNTHTNMHTNVHVNEHVNIHVNAHTNVHVNDHTNVQINVHLVAQQLMTALGGLHCDHVDYLYTYLQSCHWTQQDLDNLQTNVNTLHSCVLQLHSSSHVTVQQQMACWQAFIRVMNCAHLSVAFVDDQGNPCDVLNGHVSGNVHVELKDQTGHRLAAITTTQTDTDSLDDVSKHMEQAASSAKQLSDSGQFVPAPGATLPKTATTDPLMILIGSIITGAGAILLVAARKRANKGGM